MVFKERISAVACRKSLHWGLNYSTYSEMIQKRKWLVREQDLWYIITQSTKDENQQTAERPNITERCNKIVNQIQCREM